MPNIWMPRIVAPTVLVMMAYDAADRHGIGRPLVCAVCEEESGKRDAPNGGKETWDPNAIRFEPAFESKYIKPSNPNMPTTEELTKAVSFGLMQIMGEVARERGFTGKFLTGLCDPDTGLEFGCRQLRACIDAANSDPNETLLRWNGGADLFYPTRVMDRMAKYS
jgi:Transglycosylase SLT domain